MLPKENRLDLKRTFSYLKRNGRSYKSPLFVALYRPTTGEKTQVGFVLSKKMGHAVARNRMRRILAEAFSSVWPSLPPHLEIAVVGRIQLTDKKSTDITSEVIKMGTFLTQSLR